MSKNRIQALLVIYLQKYGEIVLNLPDGMKLEIGVTQEGKHGKVAMDNYCWLVATHEDRSACMDSFHHLGLRYNERNNRMLLEDKYLDDDGDPVHDLVVI